MSVRTIKTGMFMSLDGVVEADDDWQFAYFDEELLAGITGAWESSDTVLLGRRSFEGYDGLHADHPDSPVLAFLQGVDRVVVSTTISATDWAGTTVLGEDVYERLGELKRLPGADILVLGSPTLVRGLLGQGLLDELNLTVLPIVVGSGQRLFPESVPAENLDRLPLTLTRCTALGSGALELQYVSSGSAEATTR